MSPRHRRNRAFAGERGLRPVQEPDHHPLARTHSISVGGGRVANTRSKMTTCSLRLRRASCPGVRDTASRPCRLSGCERTGGARADFRATFPVVGCRSSRVVAGVTGNRRLRKYSGRACVWPGLPSRHWCSGSVQTERCFAEMAARRHGVLAETSCAAG